MIEVQWGLGQLQREAAEWWAKNFGPPCALQAALAVVEELGEACGELRKEKGAFTQKCGDELADVVISLAQYCTAQDIALERLHAGVLFGVPAAAELVTSPIDLARGLARATLKHHQGVRGTSDELIANCRTAAESVLYITDFTYRASGEQLLEHVERRWGVIQKRDWKRDPLRGTSSGEAAP